MGACEVSSPVPPPPNSVLNVYTWRIGEGIGRALGMAVVNAVCGLDDAHELQAVTVFCML